MAATLFFDVLGDCAEKILGAPRGNKTFFVNTPRLRNGRTIIPFFLFGSKPNSQLGEMFTR